MLGPNIAKNAALRENVFMMAICIELRIPLFLVGKPGSSKSLAKSIIQDSMHGPGSRSSILREFKQVSKLRCIGFVLPGNTIHTTARGSTHNTHVDIHGTGTVHPA